jgi:hypothetical protein
VTRGVLGAGLLLAANFLGSPGAEEPSPGFTLCVAPRPPDCVDAPPGPPDPLEDCERRVRAYVANVFKFRQCIEAESEREVRRANEVLDKWKCKGSIDCRR